MTNEDIKYYVLLHLVKNSIIYTLNTILKTKTVANEFT